MLKRKLTKEEFDALDDAKKSLYAVNPARDGEYLLNIEPDTDNAALVRSKAAEKSLREKAEARVAELEIENESLNTQITTLNANKPDAAALEKQYKDREAAQKTKHDAELAKKDKLLANVLVDQKALELASKISSTPELLVDIIKKRLKPNLTDPDNPSTDVVDAAGLASSASLQDLEKELVANPKYAAIMIASSASGSGASQQRGGSGATYKGKKFNDLNEVERIAWHKEDPVGFAAASEKNRNPEA